MGLEAFLISTQYKYMVQGREVCRVYCTELCIHLGFLGSLFCLQLIPGKWRAKHATAGEFKKIRTKMASVHASCVGLERHFEGCSNDLDAIAKSLEFEFQNSTLYRHVRAVPCSLLPFCASTPPCVLPIWRVQNPAQMLQRIKALQDDMPKVSVLRLLYIPDN